MKHSKLKAALFMAVVAIAAVGCNSPQQKADKLQSAEENVIVAQDELDQAIMDSTNEYTRFKIESETKLIENDVKIAELKAKLKSDKIEIRNKYEKELLELETKNATLKVNMSEYQESDKSQWEKFKVSFNDDMDELGKSISKMADENRN